MLTPAAGYLAVHCMRQADLQGLCSTAQRPLYARVSAHMSGGMGGGGWGVGGDWHPLIGRQFVV
jgi:hypothetical protein